MNCNRSSQIFSCASAILVVVVAMTVRVEGAYPMLSVSPGRPIVGDSITLVAKIGIPDLCWRSVELISWEIDSNQINIVVRKTDGWTWGQLCLDLWDECWIGVKCGVLPEGSYTAHLTEQHVSLREPQSLYATLVFNVRVPQCGDSDGSMAIDVSDAVFLITYIFARGAQPHPLESGDVNCDQIVNISDTVSLLNYIFSGGPAPCDNCP